MNIKTPAMMTTVKVLAIAMSYSLSLGRRANGTHLEQEFLPVIQSLLKVFRFLLAVGVAMVT